MKAKKWIVVAILLAIAMNLCACIKDEKTTEVTVPSAVATQAPTGLSPEPVETPTTAPVTEPPTEPRTPMSEVPYILTIPREGRFVYQSPDYSSTIVQAMPHGAFTITEETYDSNGKLWGRLKSGIGWICLENITLPEPGAKGIYANRSNSTLLSLDNYTTYHLSDRIDYNGIFIQALEDIHDIEIYAYNLINEETTYLMSHSSLAAGEAILMDIVIPFEFGNFIVNFYDSQGMHQSYGIYEDYTGEKEPFHAEPLY